MTVPSVFPVAVKFCEMEFPVPDVAPVAPDCAAVHEKVVPVKLPDKDIAVALPEQMIWLVGVAVKIGLGFTETTIFTELPVHPFAVGVTV